jgi:hypothetical protein
MVHCFPINSGVEATHSFGGFLMKLRYWLAPIVGAAAVAGVMATKEVLSAQNAPGKTDLRAVSSLPISRVILFSSGVAHFSRSAEVDGEARVDLTFPEQDINDLIKSMVLQDFSDKGRVSAVTYDSHEPIDRTLKSFAINLNNNPTFANILTQARGEKVEVVMQQNAVGQPGTVAGSIIGVERQKVASKDGSTEVEVLNMWCAEGVRSVKLNEVQRLRFSNPVIENEFRRALETLALSHDTQKKAVSLHFSGEGKRKVQVSYVTESPIWKTSYRLVLDKKDKPYLQGWAVVENPTDEDWTSVEMALVSGRPISFRMDLYNPLFINRPLVEPELFASLRPPTYSGSLAQLQNGQPIAGSGFGFGGGGGGGPGGPEFAGVPGAGNGLAKGKGESRGLQRGMTEQEKQVRLRYAEDLAGQMQDKMAVGRSVPSVATASALGDYFQYIIDQPVNLGRQKSALLPIINKDVDGTRVSIYNPNVQAKHPLLGLKFKNSTGMNLSQGPITVFEGSTYAGDTRVLDLQPGEERLVSYAIDLGTEVAVKNGNNTSRVTKVKAVKGIVSTETLIREEKAYDISNRSTTDRTVLIEHPNRKGQGFAFKGEHQPVEEAADVFRFSVPVASKKDLSYTVVEERTQGASITLTNGQENQIRFFLSLNEATPALKEKLQEALNLKGKWDDVQREINKVNVRIQTITTDQNRIRQNLREVPKESDAYKRYLTKFDEQEKEMDTLHAQLKQLQEQEHAKRVTYETYLGNISD